MRVPLLSATPLLAALLWVAALVVDPGPLHPFSSLLVGVGLLSTATVGVVGMIVNRGRWSRRTAISALVLSTVIAVVRPLDVIWVIALIATALSAVALLSPSVMAGIRRLPAAAGPPERAVVVPLVLIGTPLLLGLAAWDAATPATLIVGLAGPIAALWYARVIPGGLYAIRLLWPALAVGLAFAQGLASGIVSLLLGILVGAIAWHPTVKVAFHPPREIGTSRPIPPELAPKEILDAANLDEKGRPRR